MSIKQNSIDLPTTQIQYLEMGEDNATILILLHGFPENSWSWEVYLARLSEDFHVIAPDLPGYNASKGFAKESEYHVKNLVAVMASFIELVSEKKQVHVIAHDWGGVIAWPLAAFYSDLLASLTILNAAHPSTFTREMLNNPLQQRASDYISDLISDRGFEIVSANRCAMLKGLYAKGFKHLSTNLQHRLISQWNDEGSMQNAFKYYRQMPILHTTRILAEQESKLPNIRIDIPTLVLWGMRDTAFVPEVLDGMDEFVEKLTLIKYADDDHWLHHRQPTSVMANIRAFIAAQ